MNRSDTDDTLLASTYAAFEASYIRFVADCRIIADAEFHDEAALNVKDALARKQSNIDQWRSAVQQSSQLTTHTCLGALAKIRILQRCFEYDLAADDDVIVLCKSLLFDLDKLVRTETEYFCNLRLAALAAYAVTIR